MGAFTGCLVETLLLPLAAQGPDGSDGQSPCCTGPHPAGKTQGWGGWGWGLCFPTTTQRQEITGCGGACTALSSQSAQPGRSGGREASIAWAPPAVLAASRGARSAVGSSTFLPFLLLWWGCGQIVCWLPPPPHPSLRLTARGWGHVPGSQAGIAPSGLGCHP